MFMSPRHDIEWDRIYHHYRSESLPWELGKPRKSLVKLVESGRIKPNKTLDLCCGAGTNPIYLAKKGFDVTAMDISDGATKLSKEKAKKENVEMNLLIGSFLSLPFKDERFDFVFDMGCFHHVKTSNRTTFIRGVKRVLKPKGTYFLTCFSYRNGPAWNHFTRKQIIELFGDRFRIEWIRHVSSLEGDIITRFFYQALMVKPLN
jgi:ubiquinone/menaquinone biosynthesis C-methylase UbiE